MNDVILGLESFAGLLAYSTVGVCAHTVVRERSLKRCDGDHTKYEFACKTEAGDWIDHDNRGIVFGIFWPFALAGLGIGKGISGLARGPEKIGQYVGNWINESLTD